MINKSEFSKKSIVFTTFPLFTISKGILDYIFLFLKTVVNGQYETWGKIGGYVWIIWGEPGETEGFSKYSDKLTGKHQLMNQIFNCTEV